MICLRNFSFYKFALQKIIQAGRYVRIRYPIVYLIFFDRTNKWHFTRYFLSYLYGILMAFIFWDFIVYDLGLQIDFLYSILIFFIIFLGLGFTFSKRIRCVVILTCLGFWGKSGRSFLRAFTYALIISGPIKNLATNGRETIRVFSCSAILTYNLTKTRFDLMSKPFFNAVYGMKKNISTIKNTFNDMENVVAPILDEIEGNDTVTDDRSSNETIQRRSIGENANIPTLEKAEFYQNKYINKIQLRCQSQLRKGELKCKKAFAQAYEKCYEKLPALVNSMFCWPMKITIVCNIKLFGFNTNGKDVCDPSAVIDQNLGENFALLKDTENKFIANLSSVDLKYEVISPKEIPGVKSVEETGKVLTAEFVQKKTLFNRLMKIVKQILAFIFVKVIINSIRYHSQYVSNIEADNIYVTEYFKRIDKRRKDEGKHSILPLKKIESREIIDPMEYAQSKSEGKGMFVHVLKILLELITSLIFLLLDHIVYVLLDIVRVNARIDYYQEGEHVLDIQINGTGIIANLIRSTLNGFNMKETIYVKLTNEPCLPRPSHLPFLYYCKIAFLYLALTLLVCNERIVSRLRHVICAYFYRKQEKRRVLHLYNKLLKRRKQLFLAMQEIVRDEIEKHRIQNRLNFFVILRLKFPKSFGWLRKFAYGRRTCLICREPEPKRDDPARPKNFANCKTLGCYFTYCEDCWFEAGEQCLACTIINDKKSRVVIANNY